MLSLFFGIVLVIVLLLLVLLVSRENERIMSSKERVVYPKKVPAPPSVGVVNGIDTSGEPKHIHEEDKAILTAMSVPDDFSASVDMKNLSRGTSSPDTGYPGLENNKGAKLTE